MNKQQPIILPICIYEVMKLESCVSVCVGVGVLVIGSVEHILY